MPTLPEHLRQAAQHTGLDGLRYLLIEAAGALESAEPAAWLFEGQHGYRQFTKAQDFEKPVIDLHRRMAQDQPEKYKLIAYYAAPQPQERKPLTDVEAMSLIKVVGGTDETLDYDHLSLVRAIEAAHGIKD